MIRTLAALATAGTLFLPLSARAAEPPRVTSISSTVEDHSYVTLRVHFSAPVSTATSRIAATGYVGKCRHLHCTYAEFVLVPYNASRTIWIDTEVVNAPGRYVVTSVRLVPVAVGYPTQLATGAVPFEITP